jgi:hypothetical protein
MTKDILKAVRESKVLVTRDEASGREIFGMVRNDFLDMPSTKVGHRRVHRSRLQVV